MSAISILLMSTNQYHAPLCCGSEDHIHIKHKNNLKAQTMLSLFTTAVTRDRSPRHDRPYPHTSTIPNSIRQAQLATFQSKTTKQAGVASSAPVDDTTHRHKTTADAAVQLAERKGAHPSILTHVYLSIPISYKQHISKTCPLHLLQLTQRHDVSR
jgi:hypothetical protein